MSSTVDGQAHFYTLRYVADGAKKQTIFVYSALHFHGVWGDCGLA